MVKTHTKLSMSWAYVRSLSPERIDIILSGLMPDEKFRFISFEGNDYETRKVTVLLFNFFPDRVFVTVPQYADMELALTEVARFNPGVEWERMQLGYFDQRDIALNRQTQELRIVSTAMSVGADGILLLK